MTPRPFAACFATSLLTSWLASQCPLQVNALMTEPGESGGQAITTWDPDGAGPLGLHVVIAGAFAGDSIKLIEPGTNQVMQSGIGSEPLVTAVAVLGGDLIAAGFFTTAGGVAANNIARYDGSTWTPLGQGLNGGVTDLLVQPNGDLIASGSFGLAGGAPVNFVARWDGNAWSAMGAGMNQRVDSLARLPNGDIVAGGPFTMAGGAVANHLAKWNGTSWSMLGSGMNHGTVRCLQVLPNGNLVAAGTFTAVGGLPAYGYAIWDGSGLSGIPSIPFLPQANDMTLAPNGDLLIAGLSGTAYRYDGTNWSAFGSSMEHGNGNYTPWLYAIESTPWGVVTSGRFQRVAGLDAEGMAIHFGVDWQPMLTGLLSPVSAITRGSGRMLVGGAFAQVDGLSVNGIAAYDGAGWSALGGGFSGGPIGMFGQVLDIVEMPNGDVYAGGTFVNAGGLPAAGIAHWDGSSWSQLGGGLVASSGSPAVRDILLLANGDLAVTGWFSSALGGPQLDNLARWDGVSWSAIGQGLPNSYLSRLAQLPNGNLVAGGTFFGPTGLSIDGVRIFDGTSWSAPGGGLAPEFPQGSVWVSDLLVLPNGDLVVAGEFGFAGGVPALDVARWDGTAWHAYGNAAIDGSMLQLHRLPNGDLLGGGQFWIAGQNTNLLRWDGTNWTVLPQILDGSVLALASDDAGQIFAGGSFVVAGARSTLAILGSSCPATATPAGAGCTGSGGANVLAATLLPWIGSTFASRATGMPSNSLAVGVYGLGTLTTPLASVLPQGQLGCDLLVTPDLLELLVPSAGMITTSFSIPSTMALVGQQLYQQIVPVELGMQGNITALTSSNRLDLTIGAL